MGYSSQSQVEFFSQAKNRFTYDASSATLTAQNLVDTNGQTVGIPAILTLINLEKVIDEAVYHVNNMTGSSIAVMSGSAGSKTLTCTRSERDTVRLYASLGLRVMLKTGSTNVAIGGLSVNTVTNDSGFAIQLEEAKTSLIALKTAQMFNDVTFNYGSAVAKYIVVADSTVDAYCGVPSGFFAAGGYTVIDEYHDGVELQRSTNLTDNRAIILKTKLSPILSVSSFSEEVTTASWTLRTENTDFIIVKDGLRFLQNIPAAGYRNLKITYTAGYAAVPAAVANASAVLAAELMNSVIMGQITPESKEKQK